MASPVATSVTGSIVAAGTSHLFSYPATTLVGELLIVMATINVTSGTATAPTGWPTTLTGITFNSRANVAYAKIADGTEGGGTFDLVTSASGDGAANVYRITGWGGSLANDIVTGTVLVDGSTSSHTPPSASWSWGSLDALSIVWSGHTRTMSTFSTGYGNSTISTATTSGVKIMTEDKSLSAQASPEAPGSFAFTIAGVATVNTIVVKAAIPFVLMDAYTQVQSSLLGW